MKVNGRVIEKVTTRSYNVSTPEGRVLRRNRQHLIRNPQETISERDSVWENHMDDSLDLSTCNNSTEVNSNGTGYQTARAGRVSKPPSRYEPSF